MTAYVRYRSEDGIATITLDRPDKLNALNRQMAVELEEAWVRFNGSDDRVAVLNGEGRSFTAGADLKDMPTEGYGYVPGIGVSVAKPIICAVQGWCVGVGMILVMQADLCVAGTAAQFLYPEAKLGLGRGLIASLATRLPPKVAAEIMLLGEPVSSARLETHGLVNAVVPDDDVTTRARAMAEVLAGRESVINEFYKYSLAWVVPKGPGETAEHFRWRSNQLPGHRTP
jgi:enoyl-CoA hydratase/carnithine racemase